MPEPDIDTYPAYTTTQRVGEPRTPINAERIVVDLGEDEFGNKLELSIDLVKRSKEPLGVWASALVEHLPTRRIDYLPTLSATRGVSNTMRLEVKYRSRES